MYSFLDKEKQLFWNLCRFINNLQPTNSNVKLLQCYCIFLTSLNLTCIKAKNTSQPCHDSARQRTLQETLNTPSFRWARDPGITSHYAKTQDCSKFFSLTIMMYRIVLLSTSFFLSPFLFFPWPLSENLFIFLTLKTFIWKPIYSFILYLKTYLVI